MMNPIYKLAFTGALLAAPAIVFAQTSTTAPDATSPTNSSQPMPNSAQAPAAAPAAQTPSESPAPTGDQAAAPTEATPKMAQHDEMRHAKRDAAAVRETAALNTLSAEGYDDVKDVKTKGDTVDATVSKDGKTMMVEVDSDGTIKPLS